MSIPQSGGGPITSYHQLTEYLEAGCKDKQSWRIGTEHEKFGFLTDALTPLPYYGERSIVKILSDLRDDFGWDPILEGDALIGLSKLGANISLEPGGQLELSGAPLTTIHETCDEVNQHLVEVKAVSDRLNVGFIGLGAAPEWHHEQMPILPKGRYKLMTDYMGRVDTHGTQMMYRTCTVQVNLDFGSQEDMVKKFRVALALQPVATAIFANSPFFEGKPNGHKSWRSRIWRNLDKDRTGMLPFVFDEGFGFEAWAEYALDVPMYFVYRDGKYIDALGLSFRDFLKGKLSVLPGEIPTLSDWADHLTTIFPEARIKQFLEMRGADSGPWRNLCALPAFWVGICYNQNSLDAAWDIVKDWDVTFHEDLRVAASVNGLSAIVNNVKMIELARQVTAISHEGLKARACAGAGGLVPDETHFLNSIHDILEREKSPADDLLDHFHGSWGSDIKKVYEEFSY